MPNVVRFTLSTARDLNVPGAGRFIGGVLDVDANDLKLLARTRYLTDPYGAIEVGIVDSTTPKPALPAVPVPPVADPYPQYLDPSEVIDSGTGRLREDKVPARLSDVKLRDAFGSSPATRAERFSRRVLAVRTARTSETLPGASIGAVSADGAASTISGGVDVTAAAWDTGVLNPVFRYSQAIPVRAGTNYPTFESVKSSGLDSTNGYLNLAAEFSYPGTTFDVLWHGQGTDKAYRVWADDLVIGSWTGIPADGSLRRSLVTLPDARPRLIRVEATSGASFRGVTREPTATVSYPSTRAKGPRAVVVGDSFTEGTGATSGMTGYVPVLGEMMNWVDTWASGSGGTGYLNPGAGGRKTFRQRVQTDVVNVGANIVIVAGGINDTATGSAITTEAGLLYDAILIGLPKAQLIVVGPWWPNGMPSDQVLIAREAIKTAASARGLYFIDPIAEGWITGTGRVGATTGNGNADLYTSSDGTHPSDAGHEYLARRLAGHLLTLAA